LIVCNTRAENGWDRSSCTGSSSWSWNIDSILRHLSSQIQILSRFHGLKKDVVPWPTESWEIGEKTLRPAMQMCAVCWWGQVELPCRPRCVAGEWLSWPKGGGWAMLMLKARAEICGFSTFSFWVFVSYNRFA
jgi:hypothetical protein